MVSNTLGTGAATVSNTLGAGAATMVSNTLGKHIRHTYNRSSSRIRSAMISPSRECPSG